jgi:hypothetical protein
MHCWELPQALYCDAHWLLDVAFAHVLQFVPPPPELEETADPCDGYSAHTPLMSSCSMLAIALPPP